MFSASSFFDTVSFTHKNLFDEQKPVWNALLELKNYMNEYPYLQIPTTLYTSGTPLTETLVLHNGSFSNSYGKEIIFGDACKGGVIVKEDDNLLEGATVLMAGTILMGEQFSFGKGTLVEGGALIKSPTIIGDNCEVRQGAYIRGYCLTGNRCVLGHTTEIKHSIMLDDAKAGHFAYLGDSILGNNTNLGAGTKFANLRFVSGNITIRKDKEKLDSGLRKFGAILGDNTQTGCNSVTNPGTVFGKKSILMPNTTAPSGYHPDRSIIR